MDTLAEIEERCDTVKEIERKLYDLQQVYTCITIKVSSQNVLLVNLIGIGIL